ncbi:MAG: hypothetical protein NW214_03385 [Pseudanabaenaceae cyanobacterium bins.39]|nr:hypothetical protein [Pseudanabaenaceae cyanobacterium bins.39]
MTQAHYLPPLEPIGDLRSYVYGDVVIDDSVAIAAGVLIQADSGSRVTIGAGACIGMGVVIHAQDGILEIGAGANLGAGVLVYGNSKIGDRACIGASSSIVRAVIAKGEIVPPCSLINGSEQPDSLSGTHHIDDPAPDLHNPEEAVSPLPQEMYRQDVAEVNVNISETAETTEEIEQVIEESRSLQEVDLNSLVQANSAQAKAYAKTQINRYIKRIFPQNYQN